MFSEHLVCLLAAGSLRRNPLELLFELRRGQFPPLEAIACIDDFLDIELKDIAPTVFALRPLPSSQEGPKPPAAFLHSELDLLSDLIVIRNRFFGFAGKREIVYLVEKEMINSTDKTETTYLKGEKV